MRGFGWTDGWIYKDSTELSKTTATIFSIFSISCSGTTGSGVGSFFDFFGRFRKFGDIFKLKTSFNDRFKKPILHCWVSSGITNQTNWEFGVELKSGNLCFLLLYDDLFTKRLKLSHYIWSIFSKNLIFIDIEIIYEAFSVRSDSAKGGGWEDRPRDISNRALKIERKQSDLTVLTPDFDVPVVRGRQEDVFVEWVPLDRADSHAVGFPAT